MELWHPQLKHLLYILDTTLVPVVYGAFMHACFIQVDDTPTAYASTVTAVPNKY